MWCSCPLRARRAADIASGEFVKLCQDLCTQTGARLVVDMPAGLSQEEQRHIAEDFERGRSQLMYTLTLKLTHWSEMPWALAGMCHQSCDVRVETLQRALASGCTHRSVQALQQQPLSDLVAMYVDDPSTLNDFSDD
eukprot:2181338-Alexandrium_andersonii.AAC.1